MKMRKKEVRIEKGKAIAQEEKWERKAAHAANFPLKPLQGI